MTKDVVGCMLVSRSSWNSLEDVLPAFMMMQSKFPVRLSTLDKPMMYTAYRYARCHFVNSTTNSFET